MTRKYDKVLVDGIRAKAYEEEIHGVTVTVKPIPDSDIPGAMDPRVYKKGKRSNFLLKFIPKRFLQMNLKNLKLMRKVFDSVNSRSFVEDVEESLQEIPAEDGYSIPIKIFKQKKNYQKAPILYYIHGGGFFGGSTKIVSESLRYIVKRTGIMAIGVDYRLAPEYPYPTSQHDVYQVLEWINQHATDLGGDATNIFVAGDSAGGNLALYCSNRAMEEQKPYIKGQIVLYPTVNMGGIEDPYVNFSVDNVEIYDKHRKVLETTLSMAGSSRTFLKDILGTDNLLNKYLTPYSEVNPGMPITFMSCGEHDTLLAEGFAYAKKLVEVGVDTTFSLYKGMGHAYFDYMGTYPQAEDCAIDIGDFILNNID